MELKADEINGFGEWFFERGSYKLYKGDKPFEERKSVKFLYINLHNVFYDVVTLFDLSDT